MTQDEVKALFVYEPLTGLLRRVGGRKPTRGTVRVRISGILQPLSVEKPTTCTNSSGSTTTDPYHRCWTT